MDCGNILGFWWTVRFDLYLQVKVQFFPENIDFQIIVYWMRSTVHSADKNSLITFAIWMDCLVYCELTLVSCWVTLGVFRETFRPILGHFWSPVGDFFWFVGVSETGLKFDHFCRTPRRHLRTCGAPSWDSLWGHFCDFFVIWGSKVAVQVPG